MPRRPPLSDNHISRSRALRRNATFPERLLWSRLRSGRLAGVKFRRQHPLNGFIVDFYCHEHCLAIELDGDSHIGRSSYDRDRTAALASAGIRVLRIANDDVLQALDSVLELILRECGGKA